MSPSKARKTVAPQVHQRAAERDQAQPADGDLRRHVASEPNPGAKRATRKGVARGSSIAAKAQANGANDAARPRVVRDPNKAASRKRVTRAANGANQAQANGAIAARPRVVREPNKAASRKRETRAANGANQAQANGAIAARPRVVREPNKGEKRPARKHVVRGASRARKAIAGAASMQTRNAKAKAGRAQLSHLDARGQARMVEISEKPITARTAIARAELRMLPETMRVLRSGRAPKGDVLAVARVAGIQAAKRTPELIPLCHAIALTKSEIAFEFSKSVLSVEARVSALDRTGAEMEALTAASIAALTVYDMLKAIDRGMTIERVALHEKHGGKTGSWLRTRG